MLGLLASLHHGSYLRLDAGRTKVAALSSWSVDVPFGLYLGWVSLPPLRTSPRFLYFIRWNGFGIAPQVWAVIMLAVAAVLGC